MTDRDVETIRSRAKFVATLRRVADAIEHKKPVRIQVASKRFIVPADAALSVEHEAEGGAEELELQLKWQTRDTAQPSAVGARRGRKVASKKAARKTMRR